MNKTYFLDLFGCAKNQVDAETLMAYLNDAGWVCVSSPAEAEITVINSCGFIETAKRESINAVIEHKRNGKRVLLAGCLAERYADELFESLSEADVVFGNKDLSKIVSAADAALHSVRTQLVPLSSDTNIRYKSRPLLSPPGSAYVKIAEGCSNRCSFCSIPLIRGGLKSRQIEDVFDECQTLLDRGVRELCLVGQDIAAFGVDYSGKQLLSVLLESLARLDGDFWVRLLYLHPDHFPPILDFLKRNGGGRFLPYFDIPFQHASKSLLQKMNRKGCEEDYMALLDRIRDALPDAVIRSTFLLGFPGETDVDVEILLDFQEKARLDWAGCFTYSREENTPADAMKPRVPKHAAARRKVLVEEKQTAITEKQLERFVGREFSVLVEEKVDEGLYLGRMFAQAPEVDGAVVVHADAAPRLGTFTRCKVTARAGFDLTAEKVR